MSTPVLTGPAPAPVAPQSAPARGRRRIRTARPVILAAVATLAAHLLFLSTALGPDEGGFAMIARFRDLPGHYLYGPQWVDRPPGLIAVFAFADQWGPYGVRLVAALVAVTLVLAVGWAGYVLAGRTAAAWAAWTAMALASSVMLDAQELNGELIAASLVAIAIAIAATVTALRRPARPTRALALLAGAAAASAPLVKQDFFDGVAFVGVAVLAHWFTTRDRRIRALVPALVLGAALPAVATWWWARAHGGIGALAYATIGFRVDAAAVMARWSSAAPDRRAGQLLVVATCSGVLVLVGHLLVAALRTRRATGTALALGAAVAVELAGILGGGNFWSHYLIALVPTVSIAVGLATRRGVPGRRVLRVLVCATVAVTACSVPWYAARVHAHPGARTIVASWVRDSADPDDSIVVPSSNASVIEQSGLRPVYPYAWSLPVRTLDPHLDLLRSTLSGPDAPTWVVQWDRDDAWGLDPDGRVTATLRAYYRQVGEVCGRPIWLHDGETRQLPATPPESSCVTPEIMKGL